MRRALEILRTAAFFAAFAASYTVLVWSLTVVILSK